MLAQSRIRIEFARHWQTTRQMKRTSLRMAIARGALLVAIVLGAVAGRAEGQGSAQSFRASALLAQPVELSAVAAKNRCAGIPHRETYIEPPRSTTCRVIRYLAMETAAGAALRLAPLDKESLAGDAASTEACAKLGDGLSASTTTHAKYKRRECKISDTG